MNPDTVRDKTGRTPAEWFRVIETFDRGSKTHKEVADWLHQNCGVSYWWAQSICVMWEQHRGARITGQTADGRFQIGVSRTFAAPAAMVWETLVSGRGGFLLLDIDVPIHGDSLEVENQSPEGLRTVITTFHEGRRFRMKWKPPQWQEHAILQVTVTPKGEDRATITFHQEKLPSLEAREQMRTHWKKVADSIAAIIDV